MAMLVECGVRSVAKGLTRVSVTALCFLSPVAGVAQTTIQVPQQYPTIQSGIDAANNGDTVLVGPGTYSENLDFEGKAITVTSGATSYSDPRVGAAELIDTSLLVYGVRNAPIVSFVNGEGSGSVLNGFTINASADNTNYKDGTVYAPYATPTITNNHFSGSRRALLTSGGEIAGNWFSGAVDPDFEALSVGNGDCNLPSSNADVHDNLFENNTYGLTIVSFCSTDFERNIIRDNTQTGFPGVVPINSAIGIGENSVFAQNLIYGNRFDILLGFNGSSNYGLRSVVAENTFANNTAAPNCTGACSVTQILLVKTASHDGNGLMVANNIFSTSSPGPYIFCVDDPTGPYPPEMQDTLQVDHNLFSVSAQPLFDSSCRQQIMTAGNIMADPKFANSSTSDFHLTQGSPAIDAGNNSVIAELALVGGPIATDYDGNPRPVDATGRGYPILDMGAYEFPGVVDGQPTSLLLIPSSYVPNVTQSVTLTAQLSSSLGIPQGNISLYEDGVQISSAPARADGTAAFTLPPSAAGVHEFIASYAGANPYPPASSLKLVLAVLVYSTQMTLTASPVSADLGQTVTLSLSVASSDGSIPSPVSLTDNGNSLTTLLPDNTGYATFASNNFAVGSHTVVATYAGDADHLPSTATTTFTVLAGGFTLALSSPTITLSSGKQGTVNVLVSSLGNFAGPVTLSVGTVPAHMQSGLNPGVVMLTAGSSAASVLRLSDGPLLTASVREGRAVGALEVVLATLLCVPIGWRRRRWGSVMLMMVAAALLFSASGCTTVAIPIQPVAPGTYVIPVTATDANQNMQTVELTVVVTQ